MQCKIESAEFLAFIFLVSTVRYFVSMPGVSQKKWKKNFTLSGSNFPGFFEKPELHLENPELCLENPESCLKDRNGNLI